ncbi:MAG TPA: IPTL-CTERM sorting domain-containing protein [Thermoanaerobaculia bacterium]
MRRVLALMLLSACMASILAADVSIIERRQLHPRAALSNGKGKPGHSRRQNVPGKATGSQSLIDAQGLKYFINTNLTFSTSSSASAAMSEASFTHAVNATTMGGGTTSSTLNNAFNGYNAICLSLDNSFAQCSTDNPNIALYNENGPATTECLGATSGVNRQVVFPVQTIGSINVQRKVFVPDNDQFGRWLNYFTNTGSSPQTVTMITSNDLGSGSNTKIVSSSNGDNVADVTDDWITSFQNYSGTTSTEPRLGHILQGPGAATPLVGIHFVDGDRNPYWGYTFTLNPGQTKIIANFVTGQPTKAAANAKSAEISGLPANALQCLTNAERTEIVNFQAALPIAQVPTLSEAGLLGLGLLLGVFALILLRRRAVA